METVAPRKPMMEQSPLLPPLRLRRYSSDPAVNNGDECAEECFPCTPHTASSRSDVAAADRADCVGSPWAMFAAVLLALAAICVLVFTLVLILQDARRCKEAGNCSTWKDTAPPVWGDPSSPFPSPMPFTAFASEWLFKPGASPIFFENEVMPLHNMFDVSRGPTHQHFGLTEPRRSGFLQRYQVNSGRKLLNVKHPPQTGTGHREPHASRPTLPEIMRPLL